MEFVLYDSEVKGKKFIDSGYQREPDFELPIFKEMAE